MYIGIDPGPTCGFYLSGLHYRGCAQKVGLLDSGDFMREMISMWQVDAVVMEDFNLTDRRITNGPEMHATTECIGALKYVLLGAPYPILVYMRWNYQKNKVTDAMLDEHGMLRRPLREWRHANDAARHLLGWALKEGVNL